MFLMQRHSPLPANLDGGGLPGKGKRTQLQPNHGSVNILPRPRLPFPPLDEVLLPRCFPVALSALPSPPSPPSSSSSPSATSSSCSSPPSPPFRPPYQCRRQCYHLEIIIIFSMISTKSWLFSPVRVCCCCKALIIARLRAISVQRDNFFYYLCAAVNKILISVQREILISVQIRY